ncbi:hypothetical protein ACBY01_15670 [Sphingomonas sp. ac-8]|uniref:hypothetical protein n=1 Tax=Sphingomonas sp. ac-8 TaxID=3242977 RepID=UPI003A801F53
MSGIDAAASVRLWTAGLVALALGGCGDREGSERAALALSEAVYPGEFAFYDSYLQKGYYDVALVKKGDPLTRLRFAIDAEPAECRIGTACEQRLRRARADAVASAIKIKALNAGFGECGVPMLGIHDGRITSAFRTIVELDLDPADQQPGLDRLTPCVSGFRRALPADADEAPGTLALRILRPVGGRTTAPVPLTLDSRLPAKRADEPSYHIAIAAGQDRAQAADLRLDVHYVSGSGLDDKLADIARQALAKDPLGGRVPNHALNWQLKLDPQRLDVIRTYVLACSTHTPGKGPCQTDIAVRMRYDLAKGAASELAVIRNARGAHGSVDLPEMPGR